MERKYENVNTEVRGLLEGIIGKIASDAYNKGLNEGLRRGREEAHNVADVGEGIVDAEVLANVVKLLEANLGSAAEVGIFYKEGFQKAINLIKSASDTLNKPAA